LTHEQSVDAIEAAAAVVRPAAHQVQESVLLVVLFHVPRGQGLAIALL
jgi:hypothetical protein